MKTSLRSREIAVLSAAVMLGTAGIAACDWSTPPSRCVEPQRILADTTLGIVKVGTTRALTASVRGFPNVPLSERVNWTSSAPAVISVTNAGVMTAHQSGEATMTASGCGFSTSFVAYAVKGYTAALVPGVSATASLLDINDDGHILARDGSTSLLIRGGVATVLADCTAWALDNFDRVACGVTSTNRPAVWDNGTLTLLFSDTTLHGSARGISDSGYVQTLSGHTGNSSDTLFVWKIGVGPIRQRPLSPVTPPLGITNDGTVAWSATGGGQLYPSAWLWRPSGLTNITVGRRSFPDKVTDAGYVLGTREDVPMEPMEAALWSPPTWSSTGFGSSAVTLRDASSNGEVVADGRLDPVFIRHGRIIPLNDLVPAGWSLVSVAAISNDGKILGRAAAAVVLLTPVP